MIFCVDFDGTIVTHEYPKIGKPVPKALQVLRKLRENDHQIILFTMRSDERLDEAVEYLESHGIILHGINTNPTQKSWTNSPKAYGHIYIDDAGLGIPLKEDPEFSERPFVDWEKVWKILEHKEGIA